MTMDEKGRGYVGVTPQSLVEQVEQEERDRELIDRAQGTENTEAKMAEEPIEARLLRAWMNGFREGAERAQWGERWDRH